MEFCQDDVQRKEGEVVFILRGEKDRDDGQLSHLCS
jgi:hypothetical protein